MLLSLTSDTPRVLAHDPFGEHAAVQVSTVHDAARYLDSIRGEKLVASRYRVSIVGFLSDDEKERFCRLAWVLGRRAPLLVILEEADQLCPPNREPLWLKRMIAQGRHMDLSIIGVSRRPAEVSRLFTSQADTIYCFRSHEPRDVAYLRQVMGDVALRVPSLRGHQYLRWTAVGGLSAGSEGGQEGEPETEPIDESSEE